MGNIGTKFHLTYALLEVDFFFFNYPFYLLLKIRERKAEHDLSCWYEILQGKQWY